VNDSRHMVSTRPHVDAVHELLIEQRGDRTEQESEREAHQARPTRETGRAIRGVVAHDVK